MGSNKQYLENEKVKAVYQSVDERISHYREFAEYPDEKLIETECSRCMDCGTPFCHSLGCPLGTLIPEINSAVSRGDWKDAYLRLSSRNNFPEITGRLCPALCEASCSLSISGSSVSFRNAEYRIIEKAFSEGWIKPQPPETENGIKSAVIGSGPAGLAAAQQLRRSGFSVTVFEKEKQPGGLLRYGIPSFKLEKWILDRRIEILEKEGIVFETEVNVGEDISPAYLRRSFDVILLAQGSSVPRDVNALGRGLENIIFAMDYLSGINKSLSGEDHGENLISAEGKNVLIIGGGDTGSDCVGSAVRQGAANIWQYEIMDEPPEWADPSNPAWPYWPVIKRVSTSHEEGGERDWGVEVYQFSGRDIAVEKAWCRKIEWYSELDRTGRQIRKFRPLSGSEFQLDVDIVIISAGFLHVEQSRLLNNLKVKYDKKGNIRIDKTGRTSAENIYAAGDSASGPSLVARAMNSGRLAAEAVIADFKA